MGIGYRESTDSWAEVLRDLRDRGLASPLLAVGDGALGLWAALDTVFPHTRQQRCHIERSGVCVRSDPSLPEGRGRGGLGRSALLLRARISVSSFETPIRFGTTCRRAGRSR